MSLAITREPLNLHQPFSPTENDIWQSSNYTLQKEGLKQQLKIDKHCLCYSAALKPPTYDYNPSCSYLTVLSVLSSANLAMRLNNCMGNICIRFGLIQLITDENRNIFYMVKTPTSVFVGFETVANRSKRKVKLLQSWHLILPFSYNSYEILFFSFQKLELDRGTL